MDYLQEIRHRQAQALTRLLLGSRSPEETAEETVQHAAAEQGGQAGQVWKHAGESLPTEWAQRTRQHGTEQQQAQHLGDTLTEQAENFYRTRQADTLWRYGSAAPGSLPGLLMPERGSAVEMEDISRAVQRDARRYDGGFCIY